MRNQQLFDNLQIYDTVLQLMTFLWAADDASNTDIIEELQKQNSKYLETIIRQNKKITPQGCPDPSGVTRSNRR